MAYASAESHAPWRPAPHALSPTIIDLGDQPSLSEPSLSPPSAALREPVNIALPPKLAPDDDPYYALDSQDRSKKRKIERACDFCRRRKTKCDGPKMRGYTCTLCTQNGRECTYKWVPLLMSPATSPLTRSLAVRRPNRVGLQRR